MKATSVTPPGFQSLGESAARADELRAQVSALRLRKNVEIIAHPRSRWHRPEAMLRAEQHVRAEFENVGWVVQRQPFSCGDVGTARDQTGKGDTPTCSAAVDGANLIARPALAVGPPRVVVAAHLDTVKDSPGADDNASGVAGLLEIARVVAPEAVSLGLALAVLDMEETGLLGARAFVNTCDVDAIEGALVLESIGYATPEADTQALPAAVGLVYRDHVRLLRKRRFAGDWTLIIYRATSGSLARLVAESLAHFAEPERVLAIREPSDLPVLGGILKRLAPLTRDFARSDHVEFWRAGIAAVQITDTANFRNPNYHKETDTPATLDYEYLADVVAAVAFAAETFCNRVARATEKHLRRKE